MFFFLNLKNRVSFTKRGRLIVGIEMRVEDGFRKPGRYSLKSETRKHRRLGG